MYQKKVQKSGLDTLLVEFTDNSATSPAFFDIVEFPKKFTAGKNLIKLRANPTNLVPESNIQFEILDSNGTPLYYEFVDYLEDDNSRVIAIYVYRDTPPGLGTVYFAARARNIPQLNQFDIPSDGVSINMPNIKWERSLPISPTSRNSTEIIFTSGSLPEVNIRETIKPYYSQSYSIARLVTITGSNQVRMIGLGSTTKAILPAPTVLGQSTFKSTTGLGDFGALQVMQPDPKISKTQKTTTSTEPKLVQNNTIPVLKVTSGDFRFSSSMEGGTIQVNRPILSTKNGNFSSSVSYKTAIVKVLSNKKARVSDQLNIEYKGTLFTTFKPSAFTCSYIEPPTFHLTENSQSYADIRISNLKPISGDVYKVRSYMKPLGSAGNYQLIDETVLNKQDLLIFTASKFDDIHVGEFENTGSFKLYWHYDNITSDDAMVNIRNNDGVSAGTAAAIDFRTDTLQDSIRIYSAGDSLTAKGQYIPIELSGSEQYIDFYKDNNYNLQLDAAVSASVPFMPQDTLSDRHTPAGWIDVYMSGSAFTDPPPYGVDRIKSEHLGKYIGSIFGEDQKRFDNLIFDFTADRTGNGTPIFVIRGGQWYLADIHVYSDIGAGYSPEYQRLVIPVPTLAINEEQQFKFQYYDFEGNQADYTTEVFGAIFDGSNVFIDGNTNRITGELFIGSDNTKKIPLMAEPAKQKTSNYKDKGMKISGTDSAVVQSSNYIGFASASASTGPAGFLMWSGSVLPSAPDNYAGVGIEAIASSESYFRFRTNPSQLDIRTSKFFLGSSDVYISGSGNEIEISSSYFHLQRGGNLIAKEAEFDETCLADAFIYRNKVIENLSDTILEFYEPAGGGADHIRLNLTGSQAGHFVRFNFELPAPIGEINLGQGGGRGSFVILEAGANDVWIANNEGSPGTKNEIKYDATNGDWANHSFINTSGSFSDLYRIDIGDRAMLIRSTQDWKFQNASAYNSGPMFFKKGIITDDDVIVTGSLTMDGDLTATGLYITSSGQSVIQVGNTGDTLSKWEFIRNDTRRWVLYNEGRTSQAPISQDSMVFKHGIITGGAGNINMSLSPNDQGVWCHGDITASGAISSSGTITAISASIDNIQLDYANLPSSDPGVAGHIYRNGSNQLFISAG